MSSRRAAVERYTEFHWGFKPRFQRNFNDPDLPKNITGIGMLLDVKVRDQRTFLIEAPDGVWIGFDPDDDRMYIIPTRGFLTECRRFWRDPRRAPTYPLAEVAESAGGRHAHDDYPDVDVQVLGRLTHVGYRAAKRDVTGEEGVSDPDDYQDYEHKIGEENGIKPYLAVDQRGRLWIAGGDYHCPEPGITN